jgi:succinate dehydrogenase hydrophobic membrane anchor protein
MAVRTSETGIDPSISKLMDKIPVLAGYVRSRGVPFVISWAHRFAGVLLVIFIGFHIYTLSALTTPGAYAEKMKLYQLPVLAFIEWALALPVMFHALNGGRLILYESFRCRSDDLLLNWVVGLTLLYAGILAVLMLMGNQSVSAVFFWLVALPAALAAAYILYTRIRHTSHAWSWKLQRITGVFLLVMLPAHFLFMHLNPQIAKDAGIVVQRMQNPWIKMVDAALVVSGLYHGGYGLISILNDYVGTKSLRRSGTAAVIVAMLVTAIMGLKLIVSI